MDGVRSERARLNRIRVSAERIRVLNLNVENASKMALLMGYITYDVEIIGLYPIDTKEVEQDLCYLWSR